VINDKFIVDKAANFSTMKYWAAFSFGMMAIRYSSEISGSETVRLFGRGGGQLG
jgi:hypothetical protein